MMNLSVFDVSGCLFIVREETVEECCVQLSRHKDLIIRNKDLLKWNLQLCNRAMQSDFAA